MTPQENAKRIAFYLKKVQGHPLTLHLQDDGVAFTVIFPDGDFFSDGVMCRYLGQPGGKAKALSKILDELERRWIESFP